MSDILPEQPQPQNQDSAGGDLPPSEPRVVRVSFSPKDKHTQVSWILLVLTVFIYLLQLLTQNITGNDLPLLFGAKINEFILQGQIWRLITPVFLHASLVHILFNMYALYIIGPGLEVFYGHRNFLILYLLSAFAGNVFSFLFSTSVSLGASTAIFGMIAAQGIFIFRNRAFFGNRSKAMLGNIIFIIVLNLFLGLQPGIDNWGHLGGLLGGALFAWFSGPIFKIEPGSMGAQIVNARSNADTVKAFISTAVLFGAVSLVKILFLK